MILQHLRPTCRCIEKGDEKAQLGEAAQYSVLCRLLLPVFSTTLALLDWPELKLVEGMEVVVVLLGENMKTDITARNKSAKILPHPIGFDAIRTPHLGQVTALELTSVLHSLHLINDIRFSYQLLI